MIPLFIQNHFILRHLFTMMPWSTQFLLECSVFFFFFLLCLRNSPLYFCLLENVILKFEPLPKFLGSRIHFHTSSFLSGQVYIPDDFHINGSGSPFPYMLTISFFFFLEDYFFSVISIPYVGVKLTIPKSRISCSSWASQAPLTISF